MIIVVETHWTFRKLMTFISLDFPYSNNMAVNKLIITNLAAIVTFEHERLRERQKEQTIFPKLDLTLIKSLVNWSNQ